MKRCIITAIILLAYMASSVVYAFKFQYAPLDPVWKMKLWFCSNMLFVIAGFVIDEMCGYENYLHQQFNWICKLSLFINIFIVALTYISIISNPLAVLIVVNGSILVATLIITIQGVKHGIFKD